MTIVIITANAGRAAGEGLGRSRSLPFSRLQNLERVEGRQERRGIGDHFKTLSNQIYLSFPLQPKGCQEEEKSQKKVFFCYFGKMNVAQGKIGTIL